MRVLQNPRFYSKQLGDAARSALSPAQALERFVADAVKSLRETGLINTPGAGEDDGDDREVRSLVATPSGDVMSKSTCPDFCYPMPVIVHARSLISRRKFDRLYQYVLYHALLDPSRSFTIAHFPVPSASLRVQHRQSSSQQPLRAYKR